MRNFRAPCWSQVGLSQASISKKSFSRGECLYAPARATASRFQWTFRFSARCPRKSCPVKSTVRAIFQVSVSRASRPPTTLTTRAALPIMGEGRGSVHLSPLRALPVNRAPARRTRLRAFPAISSCASAPELTAQSPNAYPPLRARLRGRLGLPTGEQGKKSSRRRGREGQAGGARYAPPSRVIRRLCLEESNQGRQQAVGYASESTTVGVPGRSKSGVSALPVLVVLDSVAGPIKDGDPEAPAATGSH